MRKLIAAGATIVALSGSAFGATAQAEPGGPDGANVQVHFYDCSGPAGTPSSFDAELQHLGGAWHLTDSRQIFEPMVGFDETANTQAVVTPGFERNAVPSVTCRAVSVVNGHVYRLTGVLTKT